MSAPTTIAKLTVLCLLVVISAAMLTGCSGCRKSKTEEESKEDEKKKEEIPDFTVGELQTLSSVNDAKRNFVKPGHFVTASVPAKANKFDFQGELETGTVDGKQQPTVIQDTTFSVVVSRSARLPKGQLKHLESTYYIPRDTGRGSKTIFLQHRLRAAGSARNVFETSQVTNRMPPYRYLMVVLASNPNAYGYLNQLPSVSAPYDEMYDEREPLLHYQVILPEIDQRAPIPGHSFAWTSIAYILWDGIHPSILTQDQETAMLDWLHWGGQLIVSGPGSLDTLRGSFLAPFLPDGEAGAVQIGAEAFAELNQHWSLETRLTKERLTLNTVQEKPLMGVGLGGYAAEKFVSGTGGLVAEYAIGRGRVVVTAFSLSDREVVNWGSYDSFFNGCLLRRPPRRFTDREFSSPQPDWVGVSAASDDARLVTTTRYFSRDVASPRNSVTNSAETDVDQNFGRRTESERDAVSTRMAVNRIENELEQWFLGGYMVDPESGVAGWSDFSGVALAAQKALRDAAGISIPKAGFILRAMAIYLFFLVPVNWAFFRLLGRVEWAWVAVPVLAILGAIGVIRQAQLDIGFARSRTEVAVLEIQGGFDRGHLTRYTALYNSLASNYELRFDDPSAVARPIAGTSSPDRPWQLIFRRESDARLSRFQVVSNTTGFVHSEQMLDLGGALEINSRGVGYWQVVNNSDIRFQNVGFLHRTENGKLMVCWLGDLPARGVADLTFSPARGSGAWLPQWQAKTSNADREAEKFDDINLEPLLRLAAQQLTIRAGDLRMIGWTDDVLPGLAIYPKATQLLARTLVLAHLKYGPLPAAKPDENLLVDLQSELDKRNDLFDVMGQDPNDPDAADTPTNQEQP